MCYYTVLEKCVRRTFSLCLSLFIMFSCQENEFNQHPVQHETRLSFELNTDFEKQLVRLSTYFGMILNDEDAMKELFDLAHAAGNVGDIEYSLRRLFEDGENPVSKSSSALLSAFKGNSSSHRLTGENNNLEDFISFINAHDIEILAPYLARNFSPSDVTELTISWWTKEMEEMALAKNPDWIGETPAFKINLSNSDYYYTTILEAIKDGSIEVFMVSDEYAKQNPTIVLGAFGEDLYNQHLRVGQNQTQHGRVAQLTNVVPKQAGITCDQVLSNDILRYNMPDIRILDNTRTWPLGNFISMWVAYSAYNLQGGFPALGFTVNQLLNEKKINRGDFSWKSNFVPPLLSHWHESSIAIQLIFAHKNNRNKVDQTVIAVASNPSGGSVTSTTTIKKDDTRLYGSQTWYRCAEINGAHTLPVSPVNQLRFGNAIWQFTGGGNNRIEFTLEPRLTRN